MSSINNSSPSRRASTRSRSRDRHVVQVIAHNFGHYTARVTDFQLKTMRDGNKAFTVHAEILESAPLRANEARQFGDQVIGTQLAG